MDLFNIFVYSLVQSLCEFFPISSSGHLALLHEFLNIKDPGLEFDLFLHLASLLAIVIYFRKKILSIFINFISFLQRNSYDKDELGLLFSLCMSTLASVIFIFILKGFSEQWGRNSQIIAFNLILFGILLYVTDVYFRKNRKNTELSLFDLTLIGFSQSLAIFPGVSRSGATITMMRALRVSREDAAELSFLMAIPIILAGSIYKILPFVFSKNEIIKEFSIDALSASISFLLTFGFSFLFIVIFLKLIRNINFVLFMIYRIIIGSLVLIYNF